MMVNAKSLTHIHLLNCINSIIRDGGTLERVRILDVGCGNGLLIEYLHKSLAELYPRVQVEIYGFDVNDHGVQATGFLEDTTNFLAHTIPCVDWRRRIYSFSSDQEWIFEADFFDFVISNQVLEHVKDKRRFFKNIFCCLKNEGYSFHLAPLRHSLHEWHILVPFAHRIRSYDLLFSYIRTCSLLGIGKFRSHQRETGVSVDCYSKRHADYIMFWTSYAMQSELLKLGENAGFRSSFKFSKEYYLLKILRLFGISGPESYAQEQSAVINGLAILILRYISSVTLCLQKGNAY